MIDPDDSDNYLDNNRADTGNQTSGDTATKDDLEDEAQFEEPVASPAVLGEEDPSGSASDAESMDIDEELAKVGIEPERFDKD